MGLTYLDPVMIEQPISGLTINTLQSTNIVAGGNIQANSLTVTGTIAANNITSNYLIQSVITTDKTFDILDNSKAYHFDTGTYGPLKAIFPGNLPNGFSVTILNVDTGKNLSSKTITFSASKTINTPNNSNTNSLTNTGVLIYKYSNELYGVGVFD
jgi:YbbR domain-containing protein